jgi:putative protease
LPFSRDALGRDDRELRREATGYALSLKDLSLIEHAGELQSLGVTSLKIEGRLKRPEYVAAVVTELRRAREGGAPDMERLRAVFSRSGFTDGYFTGRRDPSMFGERTKENVVAAKDVLAEIALTVKDEPDRWPLDMMFKMRAGEAATLTVRDSAGIWATVRGPVPEAALTAALSENRLRASLAKLGGTPYFLNELTAELDGGLMLRSADLNELRRAAVQEIAEKRRALFAGCRKSHGAAEMLARQFAPDSSKGILPLRIRVRETAQLTPFLWECADAVMAPPDIALELAAGARRGDKSKLIAELPAVVFDDHTDELRQQVQSLLRLGVRHFSAGNLYAIEMLRQASFDFLPNTGQRGNMGAGEIVLHGDSGLNITNAVSMHDYLSMGLADVTLSPELSKQRILALGAADGLARAGILAYGYLPLMQLRNCPAGSCRKQGVPSCGLTDRLGKRFPLGCRDGMQTLHNCVPLYIGDKLSQFKGGPAFYTLYFTTEAAGECESVTRRFLAGERLAYETTGGLYFR